MNGPDLPFSNEPDLAQLIYGDGEFVIRRPGRWVICAVSGRKIRLDALRYWSVDRQEAYVGPEEAMQRMGTPKP